MQMVVCGHRPQKLGKGLSDHSFHERVKKDLRSMITSQNPDLVYTGMAIGVDQWAAEICLDEGIPFVAAIPFRDQPNVWPQRVQDHYRFLLKRAALRIHVDRQPGFISTYTPPDVYAGHKLSDRNRWMVDQLQENDTLVAVASSVQSGTYGTLAHAAHKTFRIVITILNPLTMRWENISAPGEGGPRVLRRIRVALTR